MAIMYSFPAKVAEPVKAPVKPGLVLPTAEPPKKKRKKGKSRPQSWTLEQFREILLKIPSSRNRLMVLVAMTHGLRVSEVINLTGSSIAGGYVNVQRLKGSQHTIQRWVKHSDPVLSEYEGLAELAKVVGADERLFPMTRFGAHDCIRRAAAKAGMPPHKRHMHCCKHTRGKLGMKHGLENVRAYLGHTSPGSTLLYCIVDDEEADTAMETF